MSYRQLKAKQKENTSMKATQKMMGNVTAIYG
jgi:hypothetical protein